MSKEKKGKEKNEWEIELSLPEGVTFLPAQTTYEKGVSGGREGRGTGKGGM